MVTIILTAKLLQMNYQKLKFLHAFEKRNSSLVKSFQDVLLSFLLMKKINNVVVEKKRH